MLLLGWTVVVLVSVMVHELGHALCGARSDIGHIDGMAAHTMGARPQDPPATSRTVKVG
jgi:hypothetical protein